MKHFSTLTLAAALLALGAAAFGQSSDAVIIVDENGNAVIADSSGFLGFSGSLQNDPGPGGLSSVLTYSFSPPGLTAGDVFLTDEVNGPLSDVIRFNPDENGGSLVYYSDSNTGIDSQADQPSTPADFYTNQVTIQELAADYGSEAFYTPTTGQPGFVAGYPGIVTYIFISTVPEPATTAAFGFGALGMVGLMFAARKRARRQTSA